MTDRELLELAAKASGAKSTRYLRNPSWEEGDYAFEADFGYGITPWNPLEDNGDAFKLAISLQMRVSERQAKIEHPYEPELCKPLAYSYVSRGEEQDSVKATKLAIVRAAASVGWMMV